MRRATSALVLLLFCLTVTGAFADDQWETQPNMDPGAKNPPGKILKRWGQMAAGEKFAGILLTTTGIFFSTSPMVSSTEEDPAGNGAETTTLLLSESALAGAPLFAAGIPLWTYGDDQQPQSLQSGPGNGRVYVFARKTPFSTKDRTFLGFLLVW